MLVSIHCYLCVFCLCMCVCVIRADVIWVLYLFFSLNILELYSFIKDVLLPCKYTRITKLFYCFHSVSLRLS